MIRFNKSVPITNIACSQYNPREITDESFALLQESLRLFGIVKPLIVNSENNVIIAGHQRKKAAERRIKRKREKRYGYCRRRIAAMGCAEMRSIWQILHFQH